MSHLLAVAGLVAAHGGTPAQIAAALLHDVVEDTDATVSDLEARFGGAVAGIVAACTDTLPGDTPEAKSPWQARKDAYVARLADADAALVVACGKLHNLADVADGVAAAGEAYFEQFRGGAAGTRWFYRAALDALVGRLPDVLAARYRAALDAIGA